MKQTAKTPAWPTVGVSIRADGREWTFENLPSAPRTRRKDGIVWTAGGGECVNFRFARADGAPMDVEWVEVRFTVPILNFSKVILPDGGREYIFKDRALFLRSTVTQVSAPNDGHPFVALVDQTGERTYAYGLLSYLRESVCRCVNPLLSARKAMRGGHDVLTLAFRLPGAGWRYGKTEAVSETLFRSADQPTWFHALRRYTALCREIHGVSYPVNPKAFDPTWCTWTAWCSDRMNEKTVLANAVLARQSGMRSIILDDGWFGPGLDTDDRPLNIGDYAPDPDKFRDLPRLIRKLHGMGLDVLLWYAPTCISPDSQIFARFKDHLVCHQGKPVMAPNGFYNLCPSDPDVRAHVRSEIERMLTAYGADGFKVDLYNTLPLTPCDGTHTHESDSLIEGVRRLEQEIWETLQRVRPGGTLELKQNYGNVISARWGTMVRAGDTAYDMDTNFDRCAYLQTYAPATHNDYFACSVHDAPRDLALMMIKSITAGVPTFSLDLVRQPPATLAVIKAWLSFYNARRPLWVLPREPLDPRLETWRMGNAETTVVTALFGAAEIRLPAARETIVLNGTGRDRLYVIPESAGPATVQIRDWRLRAVSRQRMVLKAGVPLAIPSGGLASITWHSHGK
jgi:alpha-galactosidase